MGGELCGTSSARAGGAQYAESERPPAVCTICPDEWQYLKATGRRAVGKMKLTSIHREPAEPWREAAVAGRPGSGGVDAVAAKTGCGTAARLPGCAVEARLHLPGGRGYCGCAACRL